MPTSSASSSRPSSLSKNKLRRGLSARFNLEASTFHDDEGKDIRSSTKNTGKSKYSSSHNRSSKDVSLEPTSTGYDGDVEFDPFPKARPAFSNVDDDDDIDGYNDDDDFGLNLKAPAEVVLRSGEAALLGIDGIPNGQGKSNMNIPDDDEDNDDDDDENQREDSESTSYYTSPTTLSSSTRRDTTSGRDTLSDYRSRSNASQDGSRSIALSRSSEDKSRTGSRYLAGAGKPNDEEGESGMSRNSTRLSSRGREQFNITPGLLNHEVAPTPDVLKPEFKANLQKKVSY